MPQNASQKDTFCIVKGILSHAKRAPFATPFVSGRFAGCCVPSADEWRFRLFLRNNVRRLYVFKPL